MAQNIQPRLTPPVAIPQHYVPPTARELRAQGVHRLQVGLFGLAAMLLLVGLANIIMDRARLSDDSANEAETAMGVQSTGKAASDPLADIGVVPAADPSAAATLKQRR
jgi:hypothetical protein